MISEHYVEEIEEDSDDQDTESEESNSDTEDRYESVRDMTASDIKILKTYHEVNQIFAILGLQFRFCPPPAAGEEYPQAAASSMCDIGVSGLNVSITTFNDSFISTEDEWYQKSKKRHIILSSILVQVFFQLSDTVKSTLKILNLPFQVETEIRQRKTLCWF